ncbi:unnamed protein product [Microthlaspi erraticum]|uniref:Uncharacterized protein n=1 Tax=Microthlaspi erraticum TaxID=1685480 RepID=A0A6D2JAX5_9BRAS|nr:unnamed protein product [Microthlaspi erraticum]
MLYSTPLEPIIVRDTIGNLAKVDVTYPRLPPKCVKCLRFRHLMNRCPSPLIKTKPAKKRTSFVASVALNPNPDPNSSLPSNLANPAEVVEEEKVPESSKRRQRSNGRSREKSKARSVSSPPKTASFPTIQTPLQASVVALEPGQKGFTKLLDLCKCTDRGSMGIEHKDWLLSTL